MHAARTERAGSLPMLDSGYTPQAILITGAAGFIASHVAIRLCKAYPQYKARQGNRGSLRGSCGSLNLTVPRRADRRARQAGLLLVYAQPGLDQEAPEF